MILGTYHAHTEFCDGKSTAEEMVIAAIDAGASEIGLSPHSPVAGEDWCIEEDKVDVYLLECERLKKKYASSIKVFCGIELDVISNVKRECFDYVIGSVHSVRPLGNLFWIDLSMTDVRDNVNKYFQNDPYSYVEAYYDEVGRVYEKTKCDIIGHFDLITKFIERDQLFDTTHPRYVKARDEALNSLLLTPALFEVNTGAISRGYRTVPYPEVSILERIREAGKPVVINSDSHSKDSVLFGIDEARRLLDRMGIGYVSSMEEILSFTRG